MPLLRLLLQISNMYQNVKETQSELKEQQPPENKTVAKTPPATVSGNYGKLLISFHEIIIMFTLIHSLLFISFGLLPLLRFSGLKKKCFRI